MAANQGKHSLSGAQGSRRHAHAPTQPATKPLKTKQRTSTSLRASPRAKTRNAKLPPRSRSRESRAPATRALRVVGQTRGARILGQRQNFYRFKEARGKPLDFIEFFTSSDYHSIDVRFQDKTAFHFIIDPAFTLEADYSDWKTGNWRTIRRWRPIPAQVDV